jgi:hypothetical protein
MERTPPTKKPAVNKIILLSLTFVLVFVLAFELAFELAFVFVFELAFAKGLKYFSNDLFVHSLI